MMTKKRLSLGRSVLLVLSAAVMTGCGGTKYDLAPVRGQVTCQGQPVPGGRVIFTPAEAGKRSEMPAPPAMAFVDEDGNFELYTETRKGAMVGKHRVSFAITDVEEVDDIDPSQSDDPKEAAAELEEQKAEREIALKLARMPCRRPSVQEVTVESGENVINIELSLRDDD
jgi:hypothetical protein